MSFVYQPSVSVIKFKWYSWSFIPSRPMIKQSNNIVIRKVDNIDINLAYGSVQVRKKRD
jgi:hypothetical protein